MDEFEEDYGSLLDAVSWAYHKLLHSVDSVWRGRPAATR